MTLIVSHWEQSNLQNNPSFVKSKKKKKKKKKLTDDTNELRRNYTIHTGKLNLCYTLNIATFIMH